ncbi:hypothetical protein DFQ26_001088, partial [Actinomortierella ambigua]
MSNHTADAAAADAAAFAAGTMTGIFPATIPPVYEAFLKAFRHSSFEGRMRDARAEDWLVGFDRYRCALGLTHQTTIANCMVLLFTGDAGFTKAIDEHGYGSKAILGFRQVGNQVSGDVCPRAYRDGQRLEKAMGLGGRVLDRSA